MLQSGERSIFAGLLTLDSVDAILTTARLRSGDLRIAQDGVILASSGYCHEARGSSEADINLGRVRSLYHDGATLIFNQLDRWWSPLRSFCAGLESELGGSVQTNVYLTPGGAQGFSPHCDTHDVFILQVHGRKRWGLGPCQAQLPLPSQPHGISDDNEPDFPRDIELAPGDRICIPRGWVHDAASMDGSSLHVTIGLFPPRWADLLRNLLDIATRENGALRNSLSPGSLDGDPAVLAETLRRCLAVLDSPEYIRNAIGAAKLERGQLRGIDFRGFISDAERRGEIGLDTKLRKRDKLPSDIRIEGEEIMLHHANRMIRLPSYVLPLFEFVEASAGFKVRDLPDVVDDSGKETFTRRMVGEGYLCFLER